MAGLRQHFTQDKIILGACAPNTFVSDMHIIFLSN